MIVMTLVLTLIVSGVGTLVFVPEVLTVGLEQVQGELAAAEAAEAGSDADAAAAGSQPPSIIRMFARVIEFLSDFQSK
jgi:hypothetical protein